MKLYNGKRRLAAALITSMMLTSIAPSYTSAGFISSTGNIHKTWRTEDGRTASGSDADDLGGGSSEKPDGSGDGSEKPDGSGDSSEKPDDSGESSTKPDGSVENIAKPDSPAESSTKPGSHSGSSLRPDGSKASHSNASAAKATSSNAGSVLASPSVVKPPILDEASQLPRPVAAAAVSFNQKAEFVDTRGRVISGEEYDIPETEDSFPYLSQGEGRTKGKINLADYGYVEKEYFLKGNANVYDLKNGRLATKSNAEYVNRILVFQPEDAADFNGAVYVDILNASSKVDVPDIWRRSYDFFMNSGYIYIGITSKDVNVQALKRFDPDRYHVLSWKVNGKDENGLFWDMLGQLGALIKEEDSPLLYGGDYSGSVSSYVVGQSQSGWYVNTFSNCFGGANYLLDDTLTEDDIQELEGEPHIYDGFLNVVGGMMDAPIGTKQTDSARILQPVKPSNVPFILLVGENDYNPAPVRPDSDEEDDKYRHYVIAGGAHSSKVFLPDPVDELMLRAGRPAGDYPEFKKGKDGNQPNTVSDMNMDVFINAAMENLHQWACDGLEAPYGPSTDEIDGNMSGMQFIPERDSYGNMTTGILSPQLSVPVAAYYGGANGTFSTNGGSMIYLDQSVLNDLYEDREDYLRQYEAALDEMIQEGWILELDREKLLEIARMEPVFGTRGKDAERIEEAMGEVPELTILSRTQTGAGEETWYQVKGSANMYGILHDNLPYCRRMQSLPYINAARVAVPEHMTGDVILDLIFEGEPEADVSQYMKAGTVYVGITADPKAAEEKGGSWKIPYKTNEPRTESGLVWDIISQMAAAVRSGSLFELPSGGAWNIRLGADEKDAGIAATYQLVFNGFDTYGVTSAMSGGTVALNDIDKEILPAEPAKAWFDRIRYQENGAGGPVIGATAKSILEQDGNYFKDSNGNGLLDAYEDWRLEPEERAEDLVSRMTVDDKIGMMFNNSRGMGMYQKDKKKVDATGLLDEEVRQKNDTIFGQTSTLGTTATIEELKLRHFILRQNPQPEELASWINQMNMVAEGTSLGIPVLVSSNSRNENGHMTFGMNDASGVFSTWPGTLGLAAAAMGDIANGGDASLISRFAEIGRSEWDASGLKKGYMYMADTMTDPRWQRTYGTLGEDPEFIADAIGRIVAGYQGSSEGLQADGVALTVKHFPGGGARENGFDPHYAQGQWNVYQTEDSLRRYHLPGFQAAVENHVSSIMPYYAKPSGSKSETQYDEAGDPIPMEAVGFAFNRAFIQTLLRDQMGHQGYVNSDSGIINNMAWGVEDLDVPERAALAINAGTDIIGDTNDVWSLKEAYQRGLDTAYYEGKTIPYGLTAEEVTVSDEALNRSNVRLLTEMFALGLFENPYRDPQNAKQVVSTSSNWEEAYEAHVKSVVLLKNEAQVLPLTADKLKGKQVYVEYFAQGDGSAQTELLRKNLASRVTLTDDYEQADYAILFVNPSSGNYFSATKGYLELDICDGKVVHDVDREGRPSAAAHQETTLLHADRIRTISKAVRKRGGKVISNINFTLAWMAGNVEPYSDALLAGFDTYTDAVMDIILGSSVPSGKMPITLPKDDSVIAVNADGVCISRNDVPGYAKDAYMPETMKDENGKAYAYRDSAGNYYELGFGLTYGQPDDGTDTPDHGINTPDDGMSTPDDGTNIPDDGTKLPGSGDHTQNSGSNSSHSRRDRGSRLMEADRSSGQWIKNETGWWFRFQDGTWPASAWMHLNWNGTASWYYFNSDGYMVTGWLDDEGNRYYLHPVSDGTQGYMYTGWHLIDGAWYYFNERSDGTQGRLFRSTVTPDGFQVDENGIRIINE